MVDKRLYAPVKKVKCQDCEWKKVRDYNPDFLADDVARCCFQTVWMMNDTEAAKSRQCLCFRKS